LRLQPGTFRSTWTIFLSRSIQMMSRARRVFFIQKVQCCGSGKVNSMPRSSGRESRNISPLARFSVVSATSARIVTPCGVVTGTSPCSVHGTLSYPDIALPDLLTRAAERYPDRPALRFYGRVIRYRELDALATRFAHALMNQPIRKGGVVGLMLPNLPQTVIGYYGSLRA